MMNKQTIRLDHKEENDIVITSSHSCSYIDSDYFQTVLGESTSQRAVTYSIKFMAIRADFIINQKTGLNFLKAMI